MSFRDELVTDMQGILLYGDKFRIRNYTGSIGSANYDDAQVLTKSGSDVWASGLWFPVNGKTSSSAATLIMQGKVLLSDKTLYCDGNINLSGTVKIWLGSPVTSEHYILSEGIQVYWVNGLAVYQKAFIRTLPLGSFSGEM